MTINRAAKIKVAPASVKRFKKNIRESVRQGRGRNLGQFIENDLNPKLRGWINYFKHAETKGVFEELDMWIRRKLRNIIWRQWKCPRTRWKKLRPIWTERLPSSGNQLITAEVLGGIRGASHMNAAFPKKYFDNLKLVSLFDEILKFNNLTGTAVVRNRMPGGVRG